MRTVLTTVIVLVGSCYSRPSILGQPCERARDCDDGQVCVSSRCVKTTDDDPGDSEDDASSSGMGTQTGTGA